MGDGQRGERGEGPSSPEGPGDVVAGPHEQDDGDDRLEVGGGVDASLRLVAEEGEAEGGGVGEAVLQKV
jgi:hypothetical protein